MTMRVVVAACVIFLARMVSAEKIMMESNECNEENRSVFFELLGSSPETYTVVSGSPISLRVWGVATSAGLVVDVDDVEIHVKIKTVLRITQNVSDVVTHDEISFDLCSDVVGVQCPMLVGTPFEGITTWNAIVIPHGVRFAEETANVIMRTAADPPCSTAQALHFTVEKSMNVLAWHHMAAISHNLVEGINARATSWKAEFSPRFEGYTAADARRIAGGTVLRGQMYYDELPRRRYRAGSSMGTGTAMTERRLRVRGGDTRNVDGETVRVDPAEDIPDTFDVREAFPECAPLVGRIRDQSDCGSCWAFASTEAFNDRRCIAGIKEGLSGDVEEATIDQLVVLSTEDTTACCWGFSCGLSMGCNGGQPGSAWRWFINEGVVTGGDYGEIGKGTTCKPYEFQPCAHHVDPGASGYPACAGGEYPTPECLSYCTEPAYADGYGADKKIAKEAYSLRGVQDIQRDMMRYGSVTAAFSVYSDFLAYAGGVYRHVGGYYAGGHAVKIVGWGTDAQSGDDYWLVANSWNESWGEGGFFRILRGVNECGIEASIVAGEVGAL